MKKTTAYQLAILTLLCIVLFPHTAFAYFDPGVGSMIFQGIAAGLLVLGGFWRQIKAYIMKALGKGTSDE